jgi:hypothetical protein
LRKTSFCTKGYAEIHIQRPFFDIEKGIWKILVLKNPNSMHMLWCPLYTWKLKIKIKPKSQFLVEFQSFLNLLFLGRFWQFWAVLGSVGQIWANFVALAMADSMHEL